jgi:hypothetical protein
MRGFNKIPSAVQIWLAQMIVLLFFPDPVIRLVSIMFRPSAVILKTKFGWFDLVPWTIGGLCLVWLMLTIFRPTIGRVRWVPFFATGPVGVWNSSAALRYTFPSTHPSYVFMDALAAGFAYFIYYAWADASEERRVEGLIILALGLHTPVARLFAWYGLGLRPPPPAPGDEAMRHTEDVLREGWRPVFAFYAVLVPILAIAGGVAWYQVGRDQRERLAAAVRIDPAELASSGRYFVQIRDMKASLEQTKLARITIDAGTEGPRCQHETIRSDVHYNIRARFGAAGDTMLVMSPETRDKLAARRAKGEAGPVDFIGILVRPPAPGAVPSSRRHVYCSLVQDAAQPRWIFEAEDLVARGR